MTLWRINMVNNKLVPAQKTFIRDGRSPIPKKFVTSKVMSGNKGKDTKPELLFRKALWAEGVKGYRLHWKKVSGRPDIAFPQKKVAIFINGCFWHRCPNCKLPMPQSNTFFWKEKFDKNIERDKRKIKLLEEAAWNIVIVWECELKNSLKDCINKVKILINN